MKMAVGRVLGRQRNLEIRLSLLLFLVLVATACIVAQPKPQDARAAARFEASQDALSIPFELYNGLIFVRARLSDSQPLWFLLDTGSPATLITREQARASGLRLYGRVELGGTGEGRENGTLVNGATLSISAVDLAPEITVAVAQDFFRSLEIDLGRAIDGVLGYDLFSRFVVEIDYARQRIGLYDPRSYRYSGSGEIVPIELNGRKPYVKTTITPLNGSALESNVHIDTGSTSALNLYKAFVDANHLLESAEKTVVIWPRGTGGETSARVGRVKSLQLGRFTIENPTSSFSLTQGRARPDSAGKIGAEVLRRFKVTLDYPGERMILEPNTHFAEPYELGMSGATLHAEGPDLKTFKVYKLVKGSPAAEAGLREGDIIAAVEGRPAAELTLEQVWRMFGQEGEERVLLIRRGEQTLELRIKLRRLI